ncbi:MAG: hypothetical protein U1E62_26350 [Alsobacter sp.]
MDRLAVSLSGARPSFEAAGDAGSGDTSWYVDYLERPVDLFLIEHRLQYLSEHAILDVLLKCRNALRIGGRVRISDVDWNHAGSAYRQLAEQHKPKTRLDVEYLSALLESVGLVPMPIEFRDCSGELHQTPGMAGIAKISRSAQFDARSADPELQMSSLIVDGIKVSSSARRSGYQRKIFALGDSHVRFLAGKDETSNADMTMSRIFSADSALFVGVHVGPALAFNLGRYGTKTKAAEQIDRLVKKGKIPNGSDVMCSFGEIDCRFHVCRQAETRGVDVKDVVVEVCQAYTAFLDGLSSQGYRPSVWAPFAATWLDRWDDPEHPVYGALDKRKFAVSVFNDVMAAACRERSLDFVSLHKPLSRLSQADLKRLFCDGIHLSQRARPNLLRALPVGRKRMLAAFESPDP